MSDLLPKRPSLDYLRNRARELLVAACSGQPDALLRIAASLTSRRRAQQGDRSLLRLAVAQHTIAREAGYRSWADLRRGVESIRSATTRRGANQLRLDVLAQDLVTAAQRGDVVGLGRAFSVLPNGDILAVRDRVTASGTHALLVDGLLAGLRHPAPRTRYNCASALDHLADARCAEPLRDLLQDPVPRVRRAALHSLTCEACKVAPIGGVSQEVDDLESIRVMARQDPSVRVRRAAVEMLGEACSQPAIRVTLAELAAHDPDRGIRNRAARALKSHEKVSATAP